MIRIGHILTLTILLAGCTQAPPTEERETYLLHEGLHRVARLSLKVLRATDSDEAGVQPLRAEARAHLLVYSKEVTDLSGQYDWPLLRDPLVGEVREYLKEAKVPNQPSAGTR